MRYLSAVLAVLVIGLGAASFTQASPADLTSRIAKLERTTARLKARLSVDEARLGDAAGAAQRAVSAADGAASKDDILRALNLEACGFAVSWDGIHVAWAGVNAVSSAVGLGNLFTPWTPVDDRGACAASGVARTPVVHSGIRMSPAAFGALLAKARAGYR